MIAKDFRYILKRIIIGVGICIILSLFNNNVHAMEIDYEFTDTSTNKTYTFNYNLNDTYSNYLLLLRRLNNKYIYILYGCNISFNGITSTSMGNTLITAYTSQCNNRINVQRDFSNSDNPSYITTYPSGGSTYSFYKSTLENAIQNLNFYNSNIIIPVLLNHDIIDRNNASNVLITSNFVQDGNLYNPSSTINSLGEQLIYDDNNILTNVRFSPTFENFNTSKYNYQYKIGNNNWLNITSEDVSFNVNQNTTVYFRVVNKSDDSVVDSRTYTITQIGVYDSDTDTYKIKYSSENKSVGVQESSITGFVNQVSVSFEYFPKISNLKYQYQFVEDGNSLSTWEDMPNNDYERTYTTDVNGTLYNRILDENNNILYSSTFNVNSIGMVYTDSKNATFYQFLQKKIMNNNFGSKIQDIFFLYPEYLKLHFQALRDGYCSSYDLGVLFGHHLVMPCIDVEGLVGSNIYIFIDMIFSFVVIIGIINFVVDLYYSLVYFEGGKFERERNNMEGRK